MKTTCDWAGHSAAMDEAGFCPVCQEGDLDPEWSERNLVDLRSNYEPDTVAEQRGER